MKKLIVSVLFLTASQFAFAARELILINPLAGDGPQWNCGVINGIVLDCPNATPLPTHCYKKSGSNWNVLCAGKMITTPNPPLFSWQTTPDPSIPGTYKGPAGNWIYTAPGNYKAYAIATCTDMNGSPSDTHLFNIP